MNRATQTLGNYCWALIQAPFVDRHHIAELLNDRKLLGMAVEIGTHRGDFARDFLSRWRGGAFYCVDPWSIPPGYERQHEMDRDSWHTDGNRDNDFAYCRLQLKRFEPIVHYIRQTSMDALKEFADNDLDMVYIDGDHRYEAVLADLRGWWAKVKPGGVIAGHDFMSPNEVGGGWGVQVQPAVFDFAQEHKVAFIHLILDPQNQPWSYYIDKPA